MLKIYGSMQCPDCVQCRKDLDEAKVPYEYLDFGESLKYLKEFLSIRDGSCVFDPVREQGSIGIPCIVKEDGSISLSWEEFM